MKGWELKSHPFFMSKNMKYIIFFAILYSTACSSVNTQESETDTWFTASYSMDNLPIDNNFEGPIAMGSLENTQIDEASGLAVSYKNSGSLWTHNDSGDFNRIFLFGPNAKDFGTIRLENTGNRDWEDMAIGPGPVDGRVYLYIADIGDNRAQYDIKRIFRVEEPDVTGMDFSLGPVWVSGSETIRFRYPDGMKDAETLMIDPETKDLYVVSKREFPITVYVARYPQDTEEIFEIEKLGTLPFTDATAGEIAHDGSNIVIKTKTNIYMWNREGNESISDALQRQPVRLPYTPEPQGEAFAWKADGSGYFTLSERKGFDPILYFYKKKDD